MYIYVYMCTAIWNLACSWLGSGSDDTEIKKSQKSTLHKLGRFVFCRLCFGLGRKPTTTIASGSLLVPISP